MPDTGKLVFLFLARLRGLLLIFHLAVCLVSKWKISKTAYRNTAMPTPPAKINVTRSSSFLLRRYLYTLNIELQLEPKTISPLIDKTSRALKRYIEFNSELSPNPHKNSPTPILINLKGRDPSEPALLPGAPRPQIHEIFAIGGEIATDTASDTKFPTEFLWEPFSFSLNTEFLAFEGARSILHSLHCDRSRSVPEFLPWWLLGWAAPIKPQYMRLGVELFTSRFALTRLGFIPEVTEKLYLELVGNRLSLSLNSEQLPLRGYNPFKRDQFMIEISEILGVLCGVSPQEAFVI